MTSPNLPTRSKRNRINIFERWESDAALQAFRELPSDEESVPPIGEAEVRRYRISAVEDA